MEILFNRNYEDMSLAITDMSYSEDMPREVLHKLYVASGEDFSMEMLEMLNG